MTTSRQHVNQSTACHVPFRVDARYPTSMDVRPSVQRRALLVSFFTGPLAILLVLLLGAFLIITRPEQPVDTFKALSAYQRAEYFARNFLLVWLAGSPRQVDIYKEMTSIDGKLELNPDPMTVTDINIMDVSRTTTDKPDEVEWAYTLAASTIPPGATATRNFYRVTFVEKNGAFQVISLPRLTSKGITPIKVATVYGQHAALDGTLGKMLANFSKAFLVPGGDSGALGRYASEKFTEQPIKTSPYTSVKITAIQVAKDKPVTDAKPGDSFDVLVTVKASISTTTFTTMQLPLKVSMTPNNQWLVDSITEPVDFGAVENR